MTKMTEKETKAKQAVEAFNAAHPIGTLVRLQTDYRGSVDTETRSVAFVSASGHAVVFVKSSTSYYFLDRVTPR